MRIRRGEPFMDVKADFIIPEEDGGDGEGPYPVFSEAHLYPLLGKDDARFVLGVAEEYAKLIEVLGTDAVRDLLDERPYRD